MGINAFFRDTFGANVRNERWSWGALDPVDNRLFLRVWSDQIRQIEGSQHALLLRPHWNNSSGYGERVRHIEAIREGIEAFGVICTPKPRANGSRTIKSFDRAALLRLDGVVDLDDEVWVRIAGELPATQLQRSPSGFSTLGPDLRAILGKRIENTTKQALIDARVGQGRFRTQVLGLWDRRCAVTGIQTVEAIRASHIRPWRDSTHEQRLDPSNGLPLVASLDACSTRA